jgi:hypothetical protein
MNAPILLAIAARQEAVGKRRSPLELRLNRVERAKKQKPFRL